MTTPTPVPSTTLPAASAPSANTPPTGGHTVASFANAVRQKFPGGITSDGKSYDSLSDEQLTDRIVQKYPVYQSQISDYKPVTVDPVTGASVREGGTSLADAASDVDSFGHSVVSHEVNAGEDIAAALGAPAAANQALKMSAQDSKFISTVIQMRNDARAKGEDTTHWDTILKNYKPQNHNETLGAMYPSLNKTPEQIVGDMAGVGADIVSAGALGEAGGAVVEPAEGFLAGAKEGAKAGALAGGAESGAAALQADENGGDVGQSVIKGALEGGAGGALLGGAIGGATKKAIPAIETEPKPSGGLPSKIADVGTEVVRNTARNVANYAEDAQQAVAARRAIQAKGPEAVHVLDETGSPEFVNNVDKTTSLEDLKAKQQMLETAAQHPDLGGEGSRGTLPRQVIADKYINPRIDMLQSRLSELGKTIGDAKSDSTRVDTTDLVDSAITEARKQGVVVTKNKGGFNFKKAPGISGIDASRINTIKNMFEGFKPDKNGNFSNTIEQLAQSRKNLSDLTSRSDAAKEVVSSGGAVDNTRRAIAQKIGGKYYQATVEYHDIISVLEKLDPKLGVELSEEGAQNVKNVKLSDYARRLLSNNAAQAKGVFTSLDELAQKEATRTGKVLPKQNLEDLVDTAGAIEEGLGITPRNSFFGQIKGAQPLAGVPTSLGEAAGKVKDIMTKSEASPKRALKAMQEYVEQAIAKREQ